MKLILLFSCITFSYLGCAQHDLYFGGNIMGGVPYVSYANNSQVLYSKLKSLALGSSINISYRFNEKFELQAGLCQNAQLVKMQDKEFAKRNAGFQANLKANNFYWSYFGAASMSPGIGRYSKWYLTLGYLVNKAGTSSISKNKVFIGSDEEVELLNSFNDQNHSIFFETGVEISLSKKMSWLFGVKANKGLSNISEGKYIVTKNSTVLKSDAFSSQGSYLGLTTGFKFLLFHKDKVIKTPKVPAQNPVAVKDKINKKVEGRKLIVSNNITVTKDLITIYVWDDQKVDGDRISLNLNDNWIIRDYTLEKNKKSFFAMLQPGDNVLVLHALNLGKIKPNTAAIIIDDGVSQQRLLLESDMESSGTIIIHYLK